MKLTPKRFNWHPVESEVDNYFCPGKHKRGAFEVCAECGSDDLNGGRHLMIEHGANDVDRAALCASCVMDYWEYISLALLVGAV